MNTLHECHPQAIELGWIERDLEVVDTNLEATAKVLTRILRDDQSIILLGAGMSRSSGLPTALTLVKELSSMLMKQDAVSELLASVPEERQMWNDHLAKLEFDALMGLLRILNPSAHQRLFDVFLFGQLQEEHLLFMKMVKYLGISALFSTNYDTIIEKAAKSVGLDLRVFAAVNDFPESPIRVPPIPLYKIHGGVHESGKHMDIQADFTQISAERNNRRLQLLRKYCRTHHVFVLGYGGFDYWDIFPVLYEQPSKGLIWLSHSEKDIPCITTASQSYASMRIRDNIERLLAFAPGRVRIKCNTQALLSEMAKHIGLKKGNSISLPTKIETTDNWKTVIEKYVYDRGNGALVEFGNILAACGELKLAHLAFDRALSFSESLNYLDRGHAFLGRARTVASPDLDDLASAQKIAELEGDTLLGINTSIETGIALGNRGDRENAIKILSATEQIAKENDLTAFAALCSANIGHQYAKLREFHLADQAYQKSEQLFRCAGDMPQLFLTLRNHAELLAVEMAEPESLQKALPLYLEALSISWGRHFSEWFKREMYSRVFVIFKLIFPNPSDAMDYVLRDPIHNQSGLAEHIVHRIVVYGYSLENLIMEEWHHGIQQVDRMRKNTMSKVGLVSGILCIILAVIVFVFADGLRKLYGCVFFVIMGIVILVKVWHWRRVADE